MDIRDAIEQFAEMVALGTQAMRRIGKKELDQCQLSEMIALTDEITERIARLKKIAAADRIQ